MSEPSDQELVERARKGDALAIDVLFGRYEQKIYRFGLRMCGNEQDARDVLQETLLTAFRNLASFRGDSRLSTWLYQVARSFCVKQRRRRAGEPALHEPMDTRELESLATDASAAPDAAAHAREVGRVIHAAMATLPHEYREALVLRDVEGLSSEEAAEVVGIEVGALKSRLFRGRLQLKQNLAAVLEEQSPDLGCPELRSALASYAASDIDQAACARIEAHLEGCAQCTAECDSLKRTVSMCRAIDGDEVPSSVRAAVRQALLARSA